VSEKYLAGNQNKNPPFGDEAGDFYFPLTWILTLADGLALALGITILRMPFS
jgi:hypothetical protein